MEAIMGFALPSGNEFEFTETEVTHIPTGTRFWIYPELAEVPGSWTPGVLMLNGKEYDRGEICKMAEVGLSLKRNTALL
jgi:hypothetical protein